MHAFNSRELPKKFHLAIGHFGFERSSFSAHKLTSLIPEFYARQIDAVNSGDRSYSMLLDERQQLARRAGRPLLAHFRAGEAVWMDESKLSNELPDELYPKPQQRAACALLGWAYPGAFPRARAFSIHKPLARGDAEQEI
ncbi:MAG TPA: hypothetical protein VKX49_19990 [Bryobacteraceae bacterium]|nr:hypothetical protein [Bryobacteraceae bacterium]